LAGLNVGKTYFIVDHLFRPDVGLVPLAVSIAHGFLFALYQVILIFPDRPEMA
jgi:hypothetical protein